MKSSADARPRRNGVGSSRRGGEPLFASKVDWSTWAKHAEPIRCAAGCTTVDPAEPDLQPGHFRPNHPRRKFCGRPACPGRQRRKPTTPPAVPTPAVATTRRRPRRARRRGGVPGVMAEVVLAAVTDPPQGTNAELATEIHAMLAARGGPPGAERAHVLRIVTIAAVRAAQLPGGPPDA